MPAENPIPDWAKQERHGDFAWITKNLPLFWQAARSQFEQVGRGTLIVDTTTLLEGGNPFIYLPQTSFDESLDTDTTRIVAEYDPAFEFVITLIKHELHTSTYRVYCLGHNKEKHLPV